MASVDRLYLDTNMFIVMVESSQEIARLLYELVSLQMPEEPLFLCTSELTLAELIVRPYRERDDELLRTYENMLSPGGAFQVLPIDRRVLWGAAVARSQYSNLKLPDAIHIATAVASGCTHLLTSDKGIPDSLSIYSRQSGRDVGPYRLDRIFLDPRQSDPTILEAIIMERTKA
jgi:predicted nucleic acid-binding protein